MPSKFSEKKRGYYKNVRQSTDNKTSLLKSNKKKLYKKHMIAENVNGTFLFQNKQ